MKIAKWIAACLVTLVTTGACKKQDDSISKELNAADVEFISKASMYDSSQIEMAKVAVSKTADSVVLSFAQYLLTEHIKARNDLKIMGSVVGFTVNDSTDPAHATIIAQLDSLTGRTFDSTFIHVQLAEHQAMISFYRDELNNGSQLNVTHYANTYLQNFTADYQRTDSIATAFY